MTLTFPHLHLTLTLTTPSHPHSPKARGVISKERSQGFTYSHNTASIFPKLVYFRVFAMLVYLIFTCSVTKTPSYPCLSLTMQIFLSSHYGLLVFLSYLTSFLLFSSSLLLLFLPLSPLTHSRKPQFIIPSLSHMLKRSPLTLTPFPSPKTPLPLTLILTRTPPCSPLPLTFPLFPSPLDHQGGEKFNVRGRIMQ